MNNDEAKKRVQHTFGKYADSYVTSHTHSKGEDLPLILRWTTPQPTWKALDIATGGGHVAKTIAPHVQQVYVTDLTKEMLEHSARHLSGINNLEYVIADAEQLPFLDNCFDMITCRIAPHHFPNPAQFIKEAARVLKYNGVFVMIDNIAPEEKQLNYYYNTFESMRDASHVRALPVSEWQSYLKDHGLQMIKDSIRKKEMDFQSWVRRTLDDKEQQNNVQHYMMSAERFIKDYFSIREVNHQIQSFTIDEWMVLCTKGSITDEC